MTNYVNFLLNCVDIETITGYQCWVVGLTHARVDAKVMRYIFTVCP